MNMLTRVRAGHRDAPPAPHAGTTIAHSIGATRAPSWMALRFGTPPEEGETWVGCARALTDPEFFPSWQSRLGDWLRERFGESPHRTTSGYLMSWYLHAPGFLAGMLFHTARRVPHLRPRDLAFRLADSRPHVDGVALLSEGFACLPDDPAAGTARATVVADERALAALLRARFVDHAARFVAAFAPYTRLGRRTLWAAATDVLDTALWNAGRLGGDEGAGVGDASLVLAPSDTDPLTSGSTLYAVTGEDNSQHWTRRRQSCCFHYALPGVERACVTCPRVSDSERAERVRRGGD